MDVARVAAAALLQTLEHNRSDMTRTALTPEEQAQLEDQARTVTGPRAARRTHYAVPQSAPVPAKQRPLARRRRLRQIESPENKPRPKLPKNSAQPNKPSAKRMLRPFRTRRKAGGLVIAGILACPGKGMAITTDTAERVAEPGWTSGRRPGLALSRQPSTGPR